MLVLFVMIGFLFYYRSMVSSGLRFFFNLFPIMIYWFMFLIRLHSPKAVHYVALATILTCCLLLLFHVSVSSFITLFSVSKFITLWCRILAVLSNTYFCFFSWSVLIHYVMRPYSHMSCLLLLLYMFRSQSYTLCYELTVYQLSSSTVTAYRHLAYCTIGLGRDVQKIGRSRHVLKSGECIVFVCIVHCFLTAFLSVLVPTILFIGIVCFLCSVYYYAYSAAFACYCT
jgi:hypothetical protein